MRRDSLFWGGALILLGVLLYLQTQGIINNVFQYFWPIAMLLVGIWLTGLQRTIPKLNPSLNSRGSKCWPTRQASFRQVLI